MTGKVLTQQRKAARREALPSRRAVLIGGIAAASAAVGSYTIPGLLMQARADYMTTTAEVRRIVLPDGSVATLGPNSAIALHLTGDARRIDLLRGMAYFDVASDLARPFMVKVDGATLTALGTAFDVSKDAGLVTAAVDHGLVGVERPATDLHSNTQLGAGEWVTFDGSDRAIVRGRRELSQIAAWRDGLIVAESEPISTVVARIARWQQGHVMMANPALGHERISGVFDLHDPLLALQAVVHPYGGKVRQISSYLTVISPF